MENNTLYFGEIIALPYYHCISVRFKNEDEDIKVGQFELYDQGLWVFANNEDEVILFEEKDLEDILAKLKELNASIRNNLAQIEQEKVFREPLFEEDFSGKD